MTARESAMLAHMGHWLPWVGGLAVVAVLMFVIMRNRADAARRAITLR